MRIANVHLLSLAHLMDGWLSDGKELSREAISRTLFTIRDLAHLSAEHFTTMAYQLVALKRKNALDALNFGAKDRLLNAPLGQDLFADTWKQMFDKDQENIKQEEAAEKKKAKNRLLPGWRQ